MRVLEPAVVNLLCDRRRHAPQGAEGGGPGAPGENRVGEEVLAPKARRELAEGDVVRVRTPGGGWGRLPGAPSSRRRASSVADGESAAARVVPRGRA